jgi:hypothetical protein
MTRDEAEVRVRQLAGEDSEHSYFARESDDGWEVVRIAALPGQVRPTGTSTEARPRPEADDPRQNIERLIPPFGPGLG